jgi:hypothetical protein
MIADNKRKREKLALFGLIAMGANVGINILSPSSRSRLFLIMWGFELYVKSAKSGGDIEKPKKKKPLSENDSEDKTETENSPNNESETEISETGVNAKLKPKPKVETKAETKTDAETNSKTATILQLETQFFPYEKHIRNTRQSFKRAFDKNRKPATIINRMATAQQYINALLFEGFNVWVDKDEPFLLHVDKLNKPTLKTNHRECVIVLNGNVPSMEKFEFEQEILGEVG